MMHRLWSFCWKTLLIKIGVFLGWIWVVEVDVRVEISGNGSGCSARIMGGLRYGKKNYGGPNRPLYSILPQNEAVYPAC